MADTENNDPCGINRQAYPIPPVSFPGADTSARFVFFDFIDHSLLSKSEMLEQRRKSVEQETLRCFTPIPLQQVAPSAGGWGGRPAAQKSAEQCFLRIFEDTFVLV